MNRRFIGSILIWLSCMSVLFAGHVFASVNKDSQVDTLVFGVSPAQNPEQAVKDWSPVVKYLSRKAGVKLRLKVAASIEDFEKQLGMGAFDVVYLNPYQYTTYNKTQGYVAFAREKDKKVKGIIVVKKDSPYQSLADLKDQTVVFPQEDMFAANVLPRAKLNQEAISYKSNFVESPNSVYRAVYKGDIPAGGGVTETFESLNPAVNGELRVLWTTKQYTPDAFATHPRVSKSQRTKIKDAMTNMNLDPRGHMLLNSLKMNGIVEARDSDWNDIRALQINLGD